MFNFGASKPRVKGGPGPPTPLDPRLETRFHITLLALIGNSKSSKYTDSSKSIHKNHKSAHYNKAHSLVAKTQYLIIFDKQFETKISERFGEFEYHCFDLYHKWFNIIESSEYPAFYSPSKKS